MTPMVLQAWAGPAPKTRTAALRTRSASPRCVPARAAASHRSPGTPVSQVDAPSPHPDRKRHWNRNRKSKHYVDKCCPTSFSTFFKMLFLSAEVTTLSGTCVETAQCGQLNAACSEGMCACAEGQHFRDGQCHRKRGEDTRRAVGVGGCRV